MLQKKIPLKQIEDYSFCPNFAKYNKDKPSLESVNFIVFKKILMSVYKDIQNLQSPPEWGTIRSRVSKEVMDSLSVFTGDSLGQAYRDTQTILGFVQKWFTELNIAAFPGEGFANLPLEQQLDNTNLSIASNCDAVLLWRDEVTIIDIVERTSTDINLIPFTWNSLRLQGIIWLLHKQGIQATNLVRIVYMPDDILFVRIRIEKQNQLVKRTEQRLKLIAAGISNSIYYPSTTDSCSKCPYRSICDY